MADTTSKLGKLKGRLSDLCQQIDDNDARKNDAKSALVAACQRQEIADKECASFDRKITLRGKDLEVARKRNADLVEKLTAVESSSFSLEEARKDMEENESTHDEKIHDLEDRIKDLRVQLEEATTKLTETERKNVFVQRDIVRTTEKANTLESRAKVLEDTILNAGQSLKDLEAREGEASTKEEQNVENIVMLEGEYKEWEVRCEAANRTCCTVQRNIKETKEEIASWNAKADEIIAEIDMMNDADIDD